MRLNTVLVIVRKNKCVSRVIKLNQKERTVNAIKSQANNKQTNKQMNKKRNKKNKKKYD